MLIPACHPGSILREDFLVDATREDVVTLAQKMGLAVAKLQNFIDEKIPLDDEMAQKLAGYFGTSLGFWLNLQKHYQADLAQDHRLKAQASPHPRQKPKNAPKIHPRPIHAAS